MTQYDQEKLKEYRLKYPKKPKVKKKDMRREWTVGLYGFIAGDVVNRSILNQILTTIKRLLN